MSIKIKRSVAVALMVAFDFPKAGEWDNDKLKERLGQVPEKVDASDVPEEFKAVYQELCDAKGVVDLQDDSGGEKEEKPAKAEKKSPPKKMTAAEKEERSKKDSAAIQGKAKSAKPAKTEKSAKTKAPKTEVKRDEHGVAVDSDAGKVNAALKKGWQTEDEIAEATGLEMKSVRRRLRRASRKGWAEKEKLIRYRLPSDKE